MGTYTNGPSGSVTGENLGTAAAGTTTTLTSDHEEVQSGEQLYVDGTAIENDADVTYTADLGAGSFDVTNNKASDVTITIDYSYSFAAFDTFVFELATSPAAGVSTGTGGTAMSLWSLSMVDKYDAISFVEQSAWTDNSSYGIFDEVGWLHPSWGKYNTLLQQPPDSVVATVEAGAGGEDMALWSKTMQEKYDAISQVAEMSEWTDNSSYQIFDSPGWLHAAWGYYSTKVERAPEMPVTSAEVGPGGDEMVLWSDSMVNKYEAVSFVEMSRWTDQSSYAVFDQVGWLHPSWGKFHVKTSELATDPTSGVELGRNVYSFEISGRVLVVESLDEPDAANALRAVNADVEFDTDGQDPVSVVANDRGEYAVSPPAANATYTVTVTHSFLDARQVTITVGEESVEDDIYVELPTGVAGLAVGAGAAFG